MTSGLFGSELASRSLVAICLLGDTHLSELARLLGVRLVQIQRFVDPLVEEGVLASRMLGRDRRITLNPRYFGAAELRTLLEKLGSSDVDLQSQLAEARRRPRKAGKSLD